MYSDMVELYSVYLSSYSVTQRSGKHWSPCGCFDARARTQVPPPAAVRQPHRIENESCRGRNPAEVKLPHVRSLRTETVRPINAAGKPLVRAGSKSRFYHVTERGGGECKTFSGWIITYCFDFKKHSFAF
ncbi:hypothetical protein L798_07824 [Zootermopsis nevadensis]|uniref:Uncharacterized protein n=1 Tax=Zootermopsis nevadensis TaxID=136037 RepID=A0A067R364_ZOONE|nr:hypothetical protein L798_07824 [Zootermopsis nevadensis]